MRPRPVGRVKRGRVRLDRARQNADRPDTHAARTVSAFSINWSMSGGVIPISSGSISGLARLATEVARVLKPGGRFSFLEISRADQWWAGPLYRWYLSSVIPTIGKLCLGDIDCYRMLGKYTNAFGSCEVVLPHFERAGLDCRLHQHFFGCATSITGRKPG